MQTFFRFVLLLAAIGWIGWSASVAYDFGNPIARDELRAELQFAGDLVTRLPHGWTRLLPGLLFVVSALGLGRVALSPFRLVFSGGGERALLEIGAGLMVWTWVALALGSMGQLRAAPFRAVLAVGVAVAVWAGARLLPGARQRLRAGAGSDAREPEPRARLAVEAGAWVVIGIALYLVLLGALGPEVQFDGRWYHLAQVKHYLQRGELYNMVAETRIAATGLPAYHQLLLTAVAASFDLEVAKLFTWFELVLVVGTVVVIGKHDLGSRLLGVVAALLVVSTPVVGWFGSTSANDLAVVLMSLLALHLYLRWRADPGRPARWLVLIGTFCGYAAGVKPYALSVLAVLSVGVVLDGLLPKSVAGSGRSRWKVAAGRLVVIVVSAVVAVTPWLVRSYLTTGNPTFPFLDGVLFDSPYWNDQVEAHFRHAVRQYGVEPTLGWFVKLPLLTVTRAEAHRALVGPLFLMFLPIVAMSVARARGERGAVLRRMAGYSLAVVSLWFASGLHEVRYVAFVIPPLALLISHCLVEDPWDDAIGRLRRLVLVAAAAATVLVGLQPFVPFLVHGTDPTVVGRVFIPWGHLYRGETRERVELGGLPMIRYLNHHLVAGRDKVYDGTGHVVPFYLYSNVELFNGAMWDSPFGLGQWDLGSRDAPQRLARLGVTHVVLRGAWASTERLGRVVVGRFLTRVWEAPDGEVLFVFDAAAVEPEPEVVSSARIPSRSRVGWRRDLEDERPGKAEEQLLVDGFESGDTSAWRVEGP